MTQIIVPLYNAEQIDFRFNTKPAIRFEKWNRQIERVAMKTGEQEDIPDAVAIFEEQIDENQSIDSLQKLGLSILPLIFEKAYFVYQVANEKEVFQRWSTPFSVYKKGHIWIDKKHLQSFLDISTCSLAKYDLHLALNLLYESEFRASAVEVKFFLLSIILETLSNKFINPKRDSMISQETINLMLDLARKALDINARLKDTERSRWYDLIKGNLQEKLTIKSNRDMIFEFLIDKCKLNVEEQTVKDIVRLRGKFVHSGMFDYGNKEDLQTYKNLDYLARICIIVCLTDFNPNFSYFLTPHEFLGPKFFKW